MGNMRRACPFLLFDEPVPADAEKIVCRGELCQWWCTCLDKPDCAVIIIVKALLDSGNIGLRVTQ